MRTRLKTVCSLMASIMVVAAFPMVLSAATVVEQGSDETFEWTLDSDGLLSVKCLGKSIHLDKIGESNLDDVERIKIDISGLNFDYEVSARSNYVADSKYLILYGSDCEASSIEFIRGDANGLLLSLHDFPEIDGEDIVFPQDSEIDRLVFWNTGITTLDAFDGLGIKCLSLWHCYDLEDAVIPESVESCVLYDCSNLKKADVISPDTNFGFPFCVSLSEVSLPEGVTSIEYGDFRRCVSLKSIDLPDTLENIGQESFWESGLESVTIPSSVTKIGDAAFLSCKELSVVTFDNGREYIGNYFSGCEKIKSVYIPSTVTKFSSYAFIGCDSISDVYFEGTKEQWEAISVQNLHDTNLSYDSAYELFPNAVIHFNYQKPVNEWVQDGNKWCYYDENGSKVTGWKQIDGTWYDFDSNGIMLTGWQESGNDWYYMNGSGAMVTGWIQSSGKWYFMDKSSGAMKTGWLNDGGTWYYFNGSGAMVTGWVEISGKWYYFESSGAMKTGWIQSSGDWYCLKSDGSMAASEYVRGYWLNANGKWTYEYKFTWKQDSVGWYYIDTNGWYVKSDSVMIDGKVYDFDSRGYCTNP